MTINFPCPQCGKQLTAPSALEGKQRICPHCKATVAVPANLFAPPKATADDGKDHPSALPAAVHKPPEDLIDMTAMVDIVFFLLIFFMVTSMQALESVIGLPSPEASSANALSVPDLQSDPGFVTLTIEADDTIYLDDEEVFGEQDLRVKLRNRRRDEPDLNGMLVVGNPEASHGALVMVLDSGVDAGLSELRFSVSEQPEF